MADRLNFHFRQRVTEAELDLGFRLLERALHAFATDVGVVGIVSGLTPAQHEPVPDLSVDLSAPAVAYDRLGQRVAVPVPQTVDVSVDDSGVPTQVTTPDHERWVGVYARFTRALSDPRTDGNGQEVFFREQESFELVVRQGAEADVGAAPRVPLVPDELLVCEVRLVHGQTQVLDAHIDVARRQRFTSAEGQAVALDPDAWQVLDPLLATAQGLADTVDALLHAHFQGAEHRHAATHVDVAPHGFLAAVTAGAMLHELVDKLQATQGTSGAARVGAGPVPGQPHTLSPSTVAAQLAQLLAYLNAHRTADDGGAHAASAIAAVAAGWLSGDTVQALLTDLGTRLASAQDGQGAALLGAPATPAPGALPAGTVFAQLAELASKFATHAHDDSYYALGSKVADSSLLNGLPSSAFATAAHHHDARYPRRVLLDYRHYNIGASHMVGEPDEPPDFITWRYADPSDLVDPNWYYSGPHTAQIRIWNAKAGAQNRIWVHNGTGAEQIIVVQGFHIE